MSHKTQFHVYSVLVILIVILTAFGNSMVSAAASSLLPEATAARETQVRLLSSPTVTSTPGIQPGVKPQAWLEGTIDLDQFPPMGPLVIRFNTPMSPQSSPAPVLAWPVVEGVSSWNSTYTRLIFTPNSVLDSKKTYTFFLDPSLRSADGDPLNDTSEWTAHVRRGPAVIAVSPEPGALESRYHFIELQFDKPMNKSGSTSILSVEPAVPFDLTWKSDRILQVELQQPLAPNQRYDFTLNGGNDESTVFAADGSYLAEDYRWFYWQKPFEVRVTPRGAKSIAVKFNYSLDQEKSGTPFAITPALAGEWKWVSAQELQYMTTEPIPVTTIYSLTLQHPLVDSKGFEISTVPSISFSGQPPIHVVIPNSEQREDTVLAEPGTKAIPIQFDVSVDHTSAENAFSISPHLRGKFSWQKSSEDIKETLVFELDELLQPSTTYTVKIDTSVLDSKGHAFINQPYEKSILTSWGYLLPTFGEYGDNIQVVDANGPRRIQFAGAQSDTNFAAYHFDLMEFARLYADHYHFRRYGDNIRDIPIPSDLKAEAVWKNITTREVNDGTVTETILPVELPSGLYVLNMRNGKILYDQMFLVVTQNTLVVKSNGKDVFVWLSDINGQNVPDAEVRLYSTTGEKIREGITDEKGQYRVSIPTGSEPLLVSARVDKAGLSGDVALSGFGGWDSSYPYTYRDGADFLPEGQPYLTYIYTERPIYRPGQIVNFKAIIRKDNDVRYSLPEQETPVKIRILDARGNALETMERQTNRFGSINGTVQITEGAMLGEYHIEAEVDGVITSQTFKVEDYRKPDYQIEVTSLQPEKQDKFVRGEEIKVKVNAAYYFGEPLAGKNLDVSFYVYYPLNASVKGSMVTDQNGETTLTFPAPYNPDYNPYYWDGELQPQQVRMEVKADDGSNQAVAGVYHFTVYPASEQISLDTGGYFAEANKVFQVTVRSQDLFGQPIANRKLTLSAATWNRKNFDFNPPKQSISLQTNGNGMATYDLKLEAGYHKLVLSGEDVKGNNIQVNQWIYVFSSGEDWYTHSRDQFLAVSTEQAMYKPYDKARLAIESSFSGPALLTFERGSVINTKMVELTAPLTFIDTDIIPEYAPNVYVTVNAWQAGSSEVGRDRYYYGNESAADSYLRLAKTQIQVDSTARALDVSITTDQKTYAPGDQMNAVIQVKDSSGNPVQAEVSLAVVDESIFALADDPSGDIFDAFYGPRAHSVATYDSMAPLRVIMEGGMGGGGGDEMPPAARTDFLDTSAWYPVLETDVTGQATVTVDLPDNTTSWRLTVKAVTLNHLVGQGTANIETKKDVFVRPVLPRVLTTGDLATLTAFVHNYSDQSQTMNINLSAPGLDVRSPNNESITLRPGEVVPVGWQVQVESAKPIEVTFTIRNQAGILDAVLLPLAVQPAAIRDVQNQSGQFAGTLSLALPLPDVEEETSVVRLSLNRTMSGTLLNGLEYLTGYPYGCVEQTMSRALPNAVVGRAADQLGIGGPEMEAQLDPLIKASIQRLYGLQHIDGGWGWWTDDVSDSYQTAWVLFGLGIMDNAGYPIEPKVMDRAAEWLTSVMENNSELEPRTRAYALYSMALSGRGDLEKTEALVTSSIYELDPFSQAALALAMHRLGKEETAQSILDILTQSALKQDEYVSWPQPSYDGEYHHKTMSSTIRTTALVLQAFAEIEPQNGLVPGIVRYLADQRQGIYGWGTTNETSFTILALTEYLVNEESKSGSTPYEVLVNGQSLILGTLEPGNTSTSIDIPLAELETGINSLVVKTQGDQPVYFDLSTRYDLLKSHMEATGSIKVNRRYLDPKTGKTLESFQAGQLVKVEVQIDVPENAYFLAVEDHLPGGLEALNEGLNATNEVSYGMWGYEDYVQYYWQDYGYNYKEIRGDRVAFFVTTFEKGSHTFKYYARATTTGQFLALPAQVYAMYDNDLWGRSTSTDIKIDP